MPDRLHAFRSCGLIQHVGALAPGFLARGARCHSAVAPADTPQSAAARRRSMSRAAAFALAALILYPLAMSLPVLEIHRLGARREATIWSGAVQLMLDVAAGLSGRSALHQALQHRTAPRRTKQQKAKAAPEPASKRAA